MTARDVERAAGQLRLRRERAGHCALGALAALALAPLLWQVSLGLALGLAVAALVLAGRALVELAWRRERVQELATVPEAHAIPEVRAFGVRLARPQERAKLAESIASMVRQSLQPGACRQCLFLADRVREYARELDTLARDLAAPWAVVDPTALATCRRLLTHAAGNPLYDRRVPKEELGSILRRIRAGLRPVDAEPRAA